MISPLSVVACLFWASFFLTVLAVAIDPHLRRSFGSHWKPLALIVFATLLWRVPLDGIFFHGLEYEDSYVYAVAGRQIVEGVGQTTWADDTPFSFNVCAIGSIKNCQAWEPFPEHLIGFPYVISLTARIFGSTSSAGSILNMLGSIFAAILVYSIAFRLTKEWLTAAIAAFAYAAIPVFAVYGLETSAEPFSGLFILLALELFLRLVARDEKLSFRWLVCWLAYSAVLLFSLTIKREDVLTAIVLLIATPFILLMAWVEHDHSIKKLGLFTLSSAGASLVETKIHLLQTSSSERELLERFPLTASRLLGFVESFLSSFLVNRWYAGSFVLVLLATVVVCKRRNRQMLPLILLASFILLYAAHIRSYYEMESGKVLPESALRFSMNFMGLWSIAVGLGAGAALNAVSRLDLMQNRRRLLIYFGTSMAVAALVACLVQTIRLRSYVTEDEQISRVAPARSAIEQASQQSASSALILSMDPLVVQMYGSSDTGVVDLESVDLDDLRTLMASSRVVLLKQDDRFSDVDLSRYGEPVRYVLSLPSQVLQSGEGYKVLAISAP